MIKGLAPFFIVAFLFFTPAAVLSDSAKPQRIVSLSLGSDEILLSLVDPARVVAVTRYADDPGISHVAQEAKAVPNKISQIGVESIVAFRPDLVLAASYTATEQVGQLKALGLPVLILEDFVSMADIQANVRRIGTALGETEKAEALVAEMDRRLAAVAARLSDIKKRPGVLSFGVEGWTAGKGTHFDTLLRLAGGQNLAAEAGIVGHPKLSLETVVDFDPEVLILNAWRPEGGEADRLVREHPALKGLRAVKTGRVYRLEGKDLTTVSHFIALGVEALAQRLHPERFHPSFSKR